MEQNKEQNKEEYKVQVTTTDKKEHIIKVVASNEIDAIDIAYEQCEKGNEEILDIKIVN